MYPRFISIRRKLMAQMMIILSLIFVAVFSATLMVNFQATQRQLQDAEASIRSALLAKGRILVLNNSQALQGMARDFAFTEVQRLVSSTVTEDPDVVYGIYMDDFRQPWVIANAENPSGDLEQKIELQDEAAYWAAALQAQEYQAFGKGQQEVYEFAAPVRDEESLLGTIRYGLSTHSMHEALQSAVQASQYRVRNTLFLLAAVAALALSLGFAVARRQAGKISAPVIALTKAADTIAHGDYSQTIKLHSNDEMGILASVFEKMRCTIRRDTRANEVVSEILRVSLQAIPLEQQLDRILDLILSMPLEGIQPQGAIFLLDKSKNYLVLGAHRGLSAAMIEACREVRLPQAFCAKVLAGHSPLFTTADNPIPEMNDPNKEPQAHYCIPILSEEDLLGAIHFYLQDPHKGNKEEETFLASVANTVAGIIERKLAEDALDRHRQDLERLVEERTKELAEARDLAMQANAGKSTFLANMSHEIRTPMNAILGYTQILQQESGLDRAVKDTLAIVESSGNHLLELINDILDLSKIEAGRMELNLSDFDLAGMIDDLAMMFQLRCRQKGLQWRVEQPEDRSQSQLHGDEGKLREMEKNNYPI